MSGVECGTYTCDDDAVIELVWWEYEITAENERIDPMKLNRSYCEEHADTQARQLRTLRITDIIKHRPLA